MRLLGTLILFFALINTLDYATTVMCVETLQGEEANPFARNLMECGMYEYVKLLPTALAVVIAFPADRILSGWKRFLAGLLASASAAYLMLAVVNNTILLLGFEQPEIFRLMISAIYGV